MPSHTYDALPYPSHAFPGTTPDRLATVAAIFGLSPPNPTACRVLELGCASGGNILPLAAAHPGVEVVGIDASEAQVAHGQHHAVTLPNARLHVADLTTWAPDTSFDFIVCHGVWSWVSAEVQQAVLRTIRHGLSPQGVAVVSFNTRPGWGVRAVARDALRLLAHDTDAPRRAARAQHVLDALTMGLTHSTTAHAEVLREAARHGREVGDAYLLHEYLDPFHDPCALPEFAAQASDHGLRWLGDSTLATQLTQLLPPALQPVVAARGTDAVSAAWSLDVLTGQTFRHALLVRADAPVRRDLRSFDAAGFFVASNEEEDDDPPALRDLLARLRDTWPRALPAASLLDDRVNSQLLLTAHVHGRLTLHRHDLAPAARPGERPTAWAWARAEATRRTVVTSVHHEPVRLDPQLAWLLAHCDGTRDRDALREALSEALAGTARAVGEAAPEVTGAYVDTQLDRLGELALMVA